MSEHPDPSRISQVGQETFEAEVLQSSRPVLVAFGASWSRPCHIIESVLEEVAAACAGRVKVVAVNADDHPELSLWYDVRSIPTLLYFVGGKVRATLVGTASREAILVKLAEVSRDQDAGADLPKQTGDAAADPTPSMGPGPCPPEMAAGRSPISTERPCVEL